MLRLILSVLFCLCLIGCSSVKNLTSSFGDQDNATPPTPLTKFPQTLLIDKLWSKDVGDGSDKKYLKLSPSIDADRVYIAENGGDVFALDSNTGTALWDVDTDQPVSGGPAVLDGRVFVGTQEGEVIAFDAETAQELWKARVSSEILSKPAVGDGVVVVRTIDSKLFGLEESTGRRLWVYDHKVPTLTLRGTGNPLIDSGLVFNGFDGGKLVALELSTGKPIWEARIARAKGGNELDRMVDIDAELIIDAGTIFVSTYHGNVAAVDVNSGQIIWLREISSYAGLAVTDDYVYVSDEDSNLWALDRFSGDSVWKQDKLLARSITAPAIHDDYVVVGDLEGYLHWFNSETGEMMARAQVNDSRIISTPMVEEEKLYSYAIDGTMGVYALQGTRELSLSEIEKFEAEKRAKLAKQKDVSDSYEDDSDSDGFSFNQLFDIFKSDEDEEASDEE